MQVLRHCTAAAIVGVATLLLALYRDTPVAAQQAASVTPAVGEATYVVFLGGREVGREQASLSRTAAGWTIASTGRLAAPLNLTNNRFEITYAPDWQPIELKIDARVQTNSLTLSTSFAMTTAINEITRNGVTNTKTDQITARTVVLPNNFFAAYEALGVRLAQTGPGVDIPVYVAPSAEIRLTVKAMTPATFQTPAGPVPTRRYSITFHNPAGPLDAEVTIDDRHRFARLDIGSGALSVSRQDLAGVATRQETFRNPTDVDVRIPAAGFSIAGTLTTPPAQATSRLPAIVLVPGSGPIDRDAVVAGIPLFAQLAGQLAEKGSVVLRYDKRGIGQSGGRTETVTVRDYADDAVAAVKWLARRKDVDNKRIAVVGHSEGAAIAMLAGKDKKISALVLMAGMGTTGRDLILEQQQYLLTAAKVAEPERTDRIELQKKILEATVAEKGWDALPPDLRPLVDTPWYRSLLLFDPSRAMKDLRQPILIVHGGLDTQVRAQHADRLAELARARKKGGPVEVKVLPTLNHLFVAAKTGDISEYASLEAKTIDAEVPKIVADWLATVPRR